MCIGFVAYIFEETYLLFYEQVYRAENGHDFKDGVMSMITMSRKVDNNNNDAESGHYGVDRK